MALSRKDRTRRAAILCCHCLRNIAFYRAGWNGGRPRVDREFWRNTNSGCLDIAVLEWCKLFMDRPGKHHWRKVIDQEADFHAALLARLRLSDAEYLEYALSIKGYRDRFVAHLDEDPVMMIPRMRIARRAVAFLYEHLRSDSATSHYLPDANRSAAQFYAFWYQHARFEYDKGSK